MKKLIRAFVIVRSAAISFTAALFYTSAMWAAPSAPLATLPEVLALSYADAGRELPVAFEATVTYCRCYERTMFVQDGNAAIYVQPATGIQLVAGDRVFIRGVTQPSPFRTFVRADSISIVRHGVLPGPVPATFQQMIGGQLDSTLVSVHAVVRAANLVLSSDKTSTSLQMSTESGNIDANVDSDDSVPLKDLLDAEVVLIGVASGQFDGKSQQTGVLLHVSSLADVKILDRAPASPWSLPVTPMSRILDGYHVHDFTPRVRVQGTITYYQAGSAVVLQNGDKSLWITTQSRSPLVIGDQADATGFADSRSGFLALTRGEIRDSGVKMPVVPLPSSWRELSLSKNIFDLVSIEGQVVTEVREASQDEYVLAADGQLVTAVYRHPAATSLLPLPPMQNIPLGSKVRVTGVCIPENSNPFDYDKAFNILLRSFGDITVVNNPSWLNTRNLARTVILLLLVVIAVGAWGVVMMKKVQLQTTAMAARTEAEAALERRRSRILEDINGSRPLAEILEEITEMISFKLDRAPCWCEIADGPRLGTFPTDKHLLRVLRTEIPGRSGPPLGSIYAALNPASHTLDKENSAHDQAALSAGAGLATLAIETRRLYDDLLYRSEFDQLTDIYNRASLDKRIVEQIELARQSAGIFGLIYIDLDDFKQINDVYGHQAGDLYLQEVARRMRQQLRPGDLLARLGGDEFAALVSDVHNRADIEEIALRLERSFDAPLAVDGYSLHGSASVGLALYPEDGSTKDSLISASDAAMYVAKHIKR